MTSIVSEGAEALRRPSVLLIIKMRKKKETPRRGNFNFKFKIHTAILFLSGLGIEHVSGS